jgi:hypothetical protein
MSIAFVAHSPSHVAHSPSHVAHSPSHVALLNRLIDSVAEVLLPLPVASALLLNSCTKPPAARHMFPRLRATDSARKCFK